MKYKIILGLLLIGLFCSTVLITSHVNATPQSEVQIESPITCSAGQHKDSEICASDYFPITALSTTTPSITKINIVGDVKVGKGYGQQLGFNNPSYTVFLGDLGYGSNLDSFKSEFMSLKNAKCVVGNHDSKEDGSTSIQKEAYTLCKEKWYLRTANGTTLFIGVNTNGNTQSMYDYAKSKLSDTTLMQSVKNVVLVSHKGCHYPAGSHHPVESKVVSMCEGISKQVPSGVNFYEISGHNHFMSQHDNAKWFVSGAGGKSHYEGQTGNGWNFFNNKNYGFLQLQINNGNGVIVGHFNTFDGKLIH